YSYSTDIFCDRDKSQIGGIAGWNSGTISSCTNNSTMMGRGDIGGIVGHNDGGTVSSCYNYGTIRYYYYSRGDRSIGGVVGIQNQSGAKVTNCWNYGTVYYDCYYIESTAIQPNMGQIVGYRAGGTVTFPPSYSYYNSNQGCWGLVSTGSLRGFNYGLFGMFWHNQLEYAGNRAIGRN
ncbi:MAG: hypothetical protein FWG51_05805, partial [Firmicutes bacterium]|nr:hypothetical protein [Bacillota bacterium]